MAKKMCVRRRKRAAVRPRKSIYALNRERLSETMLELMVFTEVQLLRELRRRYGRDIAIDPLQTIPQQLKEFVAAGWLNFDYPRYRVVTS